MTPLYAALSRYLSAPLAMLCMIAVYFSVLLMIVTFLIPPGHFELVYLDLGR
jgi:hypothetical protein